MDSEYLSQIENPNMKRLLLREDNIPPLEELLNAEAKKLQRLQRLKEEGKLNFGDKIKLDELTEIFPKICAEVNDFLGVKSTDIPSFGYSIYEAQYGKRIYSDMIQGKFTFT